MASHGKLLLLVVMTVVFKQVASLACGSKELLSDLDITSGIFNGNAVAKLDIVLGHDSNVSATLKTGCGNQPFLIITNTVTAIPTLPQFTVTETAPTKVTTVTVSAYPHGPQITSVGACCFGDRVFGVFGFDMLTFCLSDHPADTKLNVLTPCTTIFEPTSTPLTSDATSGKKPPFKPIHDLIKRIIMGSGETLPPLNSVLKTDRRSHITHMKATDIVMCDVFPEGLDIRISFVHVITCLILFGVVLMEKRITMVVYFRMQLPLAIKDIVSASRENVVCER
ncbi:uncharacterized protein BP5553_04057 [Venustampulla echinocandica]|uniref:Uncharacterized protein n=1 Tax=Venustampulla echinocandica TaxID=2656787 RepID=A0A370TW11_9HELO|nr:uncharacterized protein BP5553_04057 [Venustampulla echinocandica]RDL39717.1 hypothetical protein BP5553_04057 [Venustampulla echinocandica]